MGLPDCGGVRLVVGCGGSIWSYQTMQVLGFGGDSNAM